MALLRFVNWSTTLVAADILLLQISGVISWPEGTFGLPMPKTSCPVGSMDNEWETGRRTQVTEKGSHASENVHLAGIETEQADHVVQLFCMKMFYTQEDGYTWMPGKYCIFKKGDCPAKFHEGYIRWDDAASWYSGNDGKQNFKGVLPDGEYNYNTKIFYCCRTDGSSYSPIQLPSTAPFYLLKFGDVCQEVEDMSVTEEWVYWSDEKTTNLNDQGGVYPKVIRARFPTVYTKLFYCYYQPNPQPMQAREIVIVAVFVVAGLIGTTIITCVIICLVSRLCRHKRKRPTNTPSSPEHRSQCASTSPPSNPPNVYRYITLQTNEDTTGPVTPSAPPLPPSSEDPPCGVTVILRDQDFRPMSMPPTYEEVIKQMDASS